jgi:hypothetical protein
MRLRTAAPVLVALLLGAGACSGGEGTTASVDAGDDGGAARAELASAISAAQAGMPVPVSNSRVQVLLEDLCDGGGGIATQLGQLPLTDADQADAVIRALTAGTDLLCPEGVDADAAAQARAAAISVAPSTTAADLSGSAEGSGGNVAVGTAGRTSAASSSSASGGSSSGTNGGAANGSTGTATVGGGGANGTGNQSSSSFSQSVGGSGSSNSPSAG